MDHIYGNSFRVDDRQAPRYQAELDCVARSFEGDALPFRLIDISATGFRGSSEGAISPLGIISIQLPVLGEVGARLVWSHDGLLGGEFLTPIDLPRLIAGVNGDET